MQWKISYSVTKFRLMSNNLLGFIKSSACYMMLVVSIKLLVCLSKKLISPDLDCFINSLDFQQRTVILDYWIIRMLLCISLLFSFLCIVDNYKWPWCCKISDFHFSLHFFMTYSIYKCSKSIFQFDKMKAYW